MDATLTQAANVKRYIAKVLLDQVERDRWEAAASHDGDFYAAAADAMERLAAQLVTVVNPEGDTP